MSQNTKEKIEYDLVLVGGSPSSLTLAYKFLDEVRAKGANRKYSIAIIEKGEAFGSHICSGAIVNKSIFDKVYPSHFMDGMPIESVCTESHFSLFSASKKWDVPNLVTRALVPDFCKEGYYVLTLSNVVAWMAEQLQAKALETDNVDVDLFPGFAASEVLYEGDRVVGVKVGETGDELEDNVYGRIVAFGDKGFVSKDILKKFELETNPQLWSVGVKETWKLAEGTENVKGKVWHTLGYPTLDGTLGGGFIYGLDHNRLTFGLVISLDSKNPNIHPQKQLQEYKKHPFLQKLLEGGELLNYGAAVLPEGGYVSLPKKFQVDGAMLMGDALGLLDMKSLAGVDKAIESGAIAARVAYEALEAGDTSKEFLAKYQDRLLDSPYLDKYKANQYFRHAFMQHPELLEDFLPTVLGSIESTSNPIWGGVKVGFKHPIKALSSSLKVNNFFNNAKDIKEAVEYKPGYMHIDPNFDKGLITGNTFEAYVAREGAYNKKTIYSREDAVFYAHTKYDGHPEHIDEFSADTCLKCIATYDSKGLDVPCVSDCTAEVHRIDIKDGASSHGMSLENCVQCRTCELVCPEQNLRVNAAPAAGGPDFRGL